MTAELLRYYAYSAKWPKFNLRTVANMVVTVIPRVWRAVQAALTAQRTGLVYRDANVEVHVSPIRTPTGDAAYGRIRRQSRPYHITISPETHLARARLALVHELVHQLEMDHGLSLSEPEVHGIALLLESDVIPNVERMVQAVWTSSPSNSRASPRR